MSAPIGGLEYLNAEQNEAFIQFKGNLEKNGVYTASPPSHSDVTLVRFLRARKWDPIQAEVQITATEKWRKEHDVVNLFNTFDVDEFESAKKYYPRWTGRRDKGGHPIYVYRLASLAPVINELHAVPEDQRYRRIVALYTAVTRLMLPMTSHLPHQPQDVPISSVTTIVDLDRASLKLIWQLRTHLQVASQLATANFPETLHETVVVNAPAFFPTVWNWVKGWFDEGTRDKIRIFGRNPGPELLKIVDGKDLPKVYGGDLEWKYEDEPALDEDTKALVGSTFPRGPNVFVDGKMLSAKERPVIAE